MPLAVGEVFGGYRILRVLGAGAMGTVYLAQHPRLPRHDAVKVLSAELTADPQYRMRFLREADVGASLSHPGIVSIHDRGEYHGQFWISMDYVEGTDVAVLLRERYRGGMPIGNALQIITSVAAALDYAHRRGLLHRDVKPANILLAEEPDSELLRVFLSDFGIARKIDDTAGLTATNMAVGTVAYAAPEQLMGEPVDARADQYALACTAFNLLVGTPPYDFSSAAVVITRHVMSPPPSIGERRPELAVLDPVFATAMAKSPAHRFGSCQEFARELNARLTAPPSSAHPSGIHYTQAASTSPALALGGLGAPPGPPPGPPGPPGPPHAPAAAPRQRRVWRPKVLIPALVAIAVLVAAGTFAVVNSSQHHDTAPAAVTAPPNTGPFTGMYTADFAPATDLDGKPLEGSKPKTETWALRSVCGSSGCVAMAERRTGTFTLVSTMVFDDEDGSWTTVNIGSQECYGAPSEIWEMFSLQPRPDGKFSGVYDAVSSNNCAAKRPVTFTRTGDIDINSVPDPATEPARVVSPAEALHGRYHETKTYSNGAKAEETDWTVRTECLRTAARCLSYFHAPPNQAVPLVFGTGGWILNRDLDDKCDPGGTPVHISLHAQFSLPQPPQNPIALLSGRGHDEQTGSCLFSSDFDDKFARTGD